MQDKVKEKGAVIFVYPKANTPGCTKQARGFRDNCADIERAGEHLHVCQTHHLNACPPLETTPTRAPIVFAMQSPTLQCSSYRLLITRTHCPTAQCRIAGYQIFGMSADGPTSQSNWKSKEDLPFPLLCDKKKSALRQLGFVRQERIVRGHIVVGRKGLVQQYCPGLKPLESAERATQFCIEKGREGDAEEGQDETG